MADNYFALDTITPDKLRSMAGMLARIEARGESLKGDPSLHKMLRQIANGTLLPEVIVRFPGCFEMTNKIAKLSIEEQLELLKLDDDTIGQRFRPPPAHRDPLGPEEIAATVLTIVQQSSDPAATAARVIALLKDLSAAVRR